MRNEEGADGILMFWGFLMPEDRSTTCNKHNWIQTRPTDCGMFRLTRGLRVGSVEVDTSWTIVSDGQMSQDNHG
jgi:hypothetical protein